MTNRWINQPFFAGVVGSIPPEVIVGGRVDEPG